MTTDHTQAGGAGSPRAPGDAPPTPGPAAGGPTTRPESSTAPDHSPLTTHHSLRVLYVNHVSQMSGAEASLLGLIRGMPGEGFAVEAALPPGGPLYALLQEMGVPVHPIALARLKRRGSPWRQLGTSLRLGVSARLLARLARRRGIGLIHANSIVAGMAGLLAARHAHVPGVWHVRDLAALGVLGAWLGRLATRVIAISGAVAAAAEGWGVDPAKIVTIPNGVDLETFRPDPTAGAALRAEFGIPPRAFVVAMAAQIVPWKGHHVLLDALGRVRRAEPGADIRCLFAGANLFHDQDEYEALLRARAGQADLAGTVTFLGHRPDVAAVYNACDVFALPSRREPFGRALVEAMACGKPAIACAEAGPAEILTDGKTGLLVPPADAGALAEAVLRLRRDRRLAGRLAEAGREHVRREYPEARTVARVAEVYRELVAADAHRH